MTSRISSRHALEATRLAAETIRNEYYYDESAGIRVCLQKAIATANKRLAHQADRLGLKTADGNGPIGVGVAVVRGSEMYVATVGPAEAYLIRQARLSTLPDPYRARGLPSGALEPDVWRGEISVGDSLVLVSPNVIAKLGADGLKDAMLTLHPQSAMEHLHHQFVAADGSGSDGAIAFEATEVSSTSRARTLVPVRPAEPLAGAPDRSPIPLADNVQAAGSAVTAAAGSARLAAGGAFERVVTRVQDLMPHRKPSYRRVTPLASRRETQRRAALAILALVIVVGGLGLAVYAFGGSTPQQAISSVNAGQKALDQAKADLAKVTGSGIDLVTDDPDQALRLLTDAHEQLAIAQAAKVSPTVIAPLMAQTVAGLDRLYGVVPVASTNLLHVQARRGRRRRSTCRRWSAAPTACRTSSIGRPRRSTGSTSRPGPRRSWSRTGRRTRAAPSPSPRYLAVGGQDLLILDCQERPVALAAGRRQRQGHPHQGRPCEGSASLGDDVVGINTFLRPGTRGLYNLYIVDPSEQQIRAYPPAADGSGFPDKPTPWLATARDVSKMTSTYVDGDMFVADGGAMLRFVGGKAEGWDAKDPEGHVAPARPGLLAPGLGDGPSRGRDLRLRQAEQPDRRAVQGRRLVQGAVPPRRRQDGLDRPAGDVRDHRRRGPARDARLDVARRRQPGDPRRGPGRGAVREPRASPRAPSQSAAPPKATPKPTKKP